MLFKKSLFLGMATAVLSSFGALLFAWFYNTTIFDYSGILGYLSIAAGCTFVSVFASVAFWTASMVLKSWGEFIFNFFFALGSMATILYPMDATIPGDEFGYFMVYAMPLHFFPVLSWMTLKPLFFKGKWNTEL